MVCNDPAPVFLKMEKVPNAYKMLMQNDKKSFQNATSYVILRIHHCNAASYETARDVSPSSNINLNFSQTWQMMYICQP